MSATMLWRLPRVLTQRGIGKSAHYEEIRRGLFTKPVAIGARARAWPQAEVEAINAARIAGKTDDELRELVRRLEAARAAVAVAGVTR